MPPNVNYVPQPYVRGTTTGELLRLRGRNAAESELRRGDVTAQMFARLGEQISNSINSYAQQKREEPIRKQQEQMGALQVQQAQHDVDAKDRLSRQDTAFMALLEQQPTPDPREVMSIYGPQRGMQIAQGLQAFHATPDPKDLEAKSTVLRDRMLGMHALSPQLRAQVYPAVRQKSISDGLITEHDAPDAYDEAWWTQAINYGKEPAKAPGLIQRDPTRDLVNPETGAVVTPGTPAPAPARPPVELNEGTILVDPATGKVIARGNPKRDPQTNGDPGPLETIIGPDGKAIRVARKDAVNQPPAAGTEKASSGVQKRVLNFFNRAQQADTDLEAMEPEIQQMNLGGQAWQAIMPNFAQTQLGQAYTQAQRSFTEARLRKDSGAAIPPQEFDNDRKTYFAQPGDSQETLQQKRRSRAAMLASLAFESGQALGEFVGDSDEAKRIVESYKAKSAKPAKSASFSVTAPDGSKHDFATQAEADRFKQLIAGPH